MRRVSDERLHPKTCCQLRLAFEVASPSRVAHSDRTHEAAALLRATLARLLSIGHCAVSEGQLMLHARQQTSLSDSVLRRGLRHLARGELTREVIDEVPWIFPSHLRDAEIVISRRARHLASGPSIPGRGPARLERFALLCSSHDRRTFELVRRLLTRLKSLDFLCLVLASDAQVRREYRSKLGRPVFDLGMWVRAESLSPASAEVVSARHKAVVVLDASSIGVEDMAALLERIPQSAFVALVGDLRHRSRNGHGQPFLDLVASDLFQTLLVDMEPSFDAGSQARTPSVRRSGLCWRLRRSARRNAPEPSTSGS
jgi:hypothetical protein